jgi:biotin carboxyl carrier protein
MTNAIPLSQIEYPHLKGKPHWRRTIAVYTALDEAPTEATYEQLIEVVEIATGKKCSRKLISKWRQERHLKTAISEPAPAIEQPPEPTNKIISLENYRQPQHHAPTPTRTIAKRHRNTPLQQPKWLNQVAAVGTIALTIVGLGWLLTPEGKHRPLAIAEPPITQVTTPPTPLKPQSIEPRQLKINVTVATPEDLKVKPGDEIIKGQLISDRPSERAALTAKKQQLEISIQQASFPISPPIKPNFDAQTIALQQTKINNSPNKVETTLPTLNFIDPELQQVFEADKLAEINRIKQEQAKQEQTLKQQEIEIETALARLEEAKVQYQAQLTQYQQSIERQQLELTSLRSQLAEVKSQLRGVGEVRSPYSGVIKKIKVIGQNNNTMEVEVTIIPTTDKE